MKTTREEREAWKKARRSSIPNLKKLVAGLDERRRRSRITTKVCARALSRREVGKYLSQIQETMNEIIRLAS